MRAFGPSPYKILKPNFSLFAFFPRPDESLLTKDSSEKVPADPVGLAR